jgi:hypothetical protein
MAITCEDRAAITEVIARHGHLCDSGELDRLDEVFTADVTYDLTDLGQRPPGGWGEVSPVGHHVTNVILTETADGTVQARSKGIGVNAMNPSVPTLISSLFATASAVAITSL